MLSTRASISGSRIVFLIAAVLTLAADSFAAGPAEKVVYSFLGNPDGSNPNASLVADAAGNLYGTTIGSGTGKAGTVFELSPPATAGAAWTETVLHSFDVVPDDGAFPTGTLIFDKLGNLYGTTNRGGSNREGTVFELTPPTSAGGAWTETVLWAFAPKASAGSNPTGKLAIDAKGNLYGTASKGGSNRCSGNGCGTVFELIAPKTSEGVWAEKVIYNFAAMNDGLAPGGDLLLRNGILYGTTTLGGLFNSGTVFQLTSKPGIWTETILYNFTSGSDGADPSGGLIADSAGNLYGTTTGESVFCKENCTGTIYELSPPTMAGDSWVESTLHALINPGDGKNPFGPLLLDKLGDLYGTAYDGGNGNSTLGTVFKLKPPASGGTWTLAVLHYFRGLSAGDGAGPLGGLILVNGTFYGTTYNGGTKITPDITGGTVFSLVP